MLLSGKPRYPRGGEAESVEESRLGVYPPNAHVRVAAPVGVSDEAVTLAVVIDVG